MARQTLSCSSPISGDLAKTVSDEGRREFEGHAEHEGDGVPDEPRRHGRLET